MIDYITRKTAEAAAKRRTAAAQTIQSADHHAQPDTHQQTTLNAAPEVDIFGHDFKRVHNVSGSAGVFFAFAFFRVSRVRHRVQALANLGGDVLWVHCKVGRRIRELFLTPFLHLHNFVEP